jgi:carbonic anhydrase
MSAIDDLLKNSERYAAGFDKAGLDKSPATGVAIVACMDARLLPTKILGLDEGDAHVIRNPGGTVGDEELRSLAISQRKLGTSEIVVIQHTDCGMAGFDDEEFRRELRDETGQEPHWEGERFDDPEEGVRRSIARIKASPFIPRKASVRGFVYEVETGRLREVTP